MLHIELSLATAPKFASPSAVNVTAGDVALHVPERTQGLKAGKRMKMYKIAAAVVMTILAPSITRLAGRGFGLHSDVGEMRSYPDD